MSSCRHLLDAAPGGRFLHAAVVQKGLLLVFGGNGHNDTVYSLGSKCFTSEVLVYDILCDSWTLMDPPLDLPTDISRYGHSATLYDNSAYLFGGFNGLVLNDLVRYTPGSCDELKITNNRSCVDSRTYGVKCQWNKALKRCEGVNYLPAKDKEKDGWFDRCLEDSRKIGSPGVCESFRTCSACVQNKLGCVWCGNQCQYSKCKDSRHKVSLFGFDSMINFSRLCF